MEGDPGSTTGTQAGGEAPDSSAYPRPGSPGERQPESLRDHKAQSLLDRQPQSLWDHKPWWCQPWSILSTGIALIALSWWLGQRWWIGLPVTVAIALWGWLFLVLVPAAYRRAGAAAEQPPSLAVQGGEGSDSPLAEDQARKTH